MKVDAFVNDLMGSPLYAGQIVHQHKVDARAARYGQPHRPLSGVAHQFLAAQGIRRLYVHQAE